MATEAAAVGVPRAAPVEAPARARGRLDFVDWARGVACVLMFEAHIFDAWVMPTDKIVGGGVDSPPWTWSRWDVSRFLASIPSSLFVFLAGVGIALKADSALLRSSDPANTVRQTRKEIAWRGLGVLGFGLFFRVFYYLVDLARVDDWRQLFHVDILNLIGAAIMLAALLLPRRAGSLNLAALVTGVGVAGLTPVVSRLFRHLPDAVPWMLSDYVAERQAWGGFPIFPMASFVFFGLFVGALIARWRRAESQRALAIGSLLCIVVGGVVAVAARNLSFYLYHVFWPTHQNGRADWAVIAQVLSFAGLETAFLGGCYFIKRLLPAGRLQPMVVLGQTSLLVYFVHIELAYGLVATGIKAHLSFSATTVGLVVVTALMVGVGLFRLHAADWLRRNRVTLILALAWALLAYTIVARLAVPYPSTPAAIVVLWFAALTASCAAAALVVRRAVLP
jgi:uncharacterized membrane protein